ncbi:MAG: type 4a pilus biogenesis protein PilO [Elusimicrobia bacterium]|nr:type 4a pilus biogenesis protein PilO [Elusimicrobiota bacterium]
MPALFILVDKIKAFVIDMTDNIAIIYTDKGIEPFKKPLIYALPLLLILYSAVYSPLGSRVKNRVAELEKLRLISVHAADYQEANTRYTAYQRRLPLFKDKDEWLSYVMTSTAKSQGIEFDQFSAQTESEVGNFLLISREASVTTTYARLGRWIADMENSPILLKVSALDLRKDPMTAGIIKATIKLSTIFPRFGAPAPGQQKTPGNEGKI